MIKRLIPILMLVALTLHCAVGDAFEQRWPGINRFMQGGISNLVVGGIVTNMPVGGYVQYVGSNTWKIWFPVGGIVTQVVTYIPPVQYLNVSGGLLTMSGDPTGGVNVVELVPASLVTAGFVTGEGTPEASWLIAKGSNPVRIRRDVNGLSVRNYADDEYRDVVCRNLTVIGTNNISNLGVVNVDTNRIVLNANITSGAPTMDAFLSVSRGSSATASVQWVESSGKWVFGYQGAMYSIADYATQAVAQAWAGITNIGQTAEDAVSNRWPWVMAITPTQIHNWETVHVWSTNETVDAVTNQWVWLNDWFSTWSNWLGTNGISTNVVVSESSSPSSGSITGKTLYINIKTNPSSSGITDAPADGTLYGRVNNAWSNVPSSGASSSGLGLTNLFTANMAGVDQSLGSSFTWYKANMTNVVVNSGNNVNTNGRYVVTANNKYVFGWQLVSVNSGRLTAGLYINGVLRFTTHFFATVSPDGVDRTVSGGVSPIMNLSSNDYVEIWALRGAAATSIWGDTNNCWFSGWRAQ